MHESFRGASLDARDAKEAGYAVFSGLAKAERGQFVLYQFDTKEFEDYANHMRATDPERWRRIANGQCRAVADGRDIAVGSLAFLDEILPEMAAQGFHREDVLAYKPAAGKAGPTKPPGALLLSSFE